MPNCFNLGESRSSLMASIIMGIFQGAPPQCYPFPLGIEAFSKDDYITTCLSLHKAGVNPHLIRHETAGLEGVPQPDP